MTGFKATSFRDSQRLRRFMSSSQFPPALELTGFKGAILATNPTWACFHNEAPGTLVANNQGTGVDGTYQNMNALSLGNPALYTDGGTCWDTTAGSSSYCDIPASILPAPSTTHSMGLLFKRKTVGATHALIDRDSEASTRFWQWRFDNATNLNYIQITPGVQVDAFDLGMPALQLALVILTRDATGQIKTYKNDILVRDTDYSAADLGHNSAILRIARRVQGDSQADYQVAGSFVWPQVLTAAEIANLYNSGLAPPPPPAGSFRYWRIYSTANNGDASYTSIAEIELRIAGVDQTGPGGAATSSGNHAIGPPADAFDNSTASLDSWVGLGVNPCWITYDFTAGQEKIITSAALWPEPGFETRAPKDFVIQGSNDNLAWTTLSAQTNITGWAGGVAKTFSW